MFSHLLLQWKNDERKGEFEMNNNDRLARIRYALDIKDADMVKILHLGGSDFSKDEVKDLLQKVESEEQETQYEKVCSNETLERFLNGFIMSKRGESSHEMPLELTNENANNLLLKKMKIALSLKSEDILDILKEAGVSISKSELSAVLRKEGHRNYKPCGDRYVRNFLKGLALRYRP